MDFELWSLNNHCLNYIIIYNRDDFDFIFDFIIEIFIDIFTILIIEFVNFNESIFTEEPKRVARNELI